MIHKTNYNYLAILTDSRYREKIVNQLAEELNSYEFDAIAFCGMSGALVAPQLASTLNKNLILVRKKGDARHSTDSVEGVTKCDYYVVIDDFIATGQTVNRIINLVKGQCVGIWCYDLYGVVDYNIKFGLSKHSTGSNPIFSGVPVFVRI